MSKDIVPNFVMQIMQKNPRIGRKQLAKEANITESMARFYCKVYREKHRPVKCVARGVALYDIHYPDHDRAALQIALQFIDDFKPDYLVLGGDQMQMDSISFFNKNKVKLIEGKRLKKDYLGFQKDVLDQLDLILKRDTKRYFLIGNHEYRVERLLENSPQHEGFIEIDKNLDLSKYKIIPFNMLMNLGELYFTHGWHYNIHYAKQTVLEAQKMIFVGHAHMPQVYTAVGPAEALPKQCVGIGCLCNKNPHYMSNRPNAWVHQFMFWYQFEDGTFTYYTPIIINGRCVINNKVYDGNY